MEVNIKRRMLLSLYSSTLVIV